MTEKAKYTGWHLLLPLLAGASVWATFHLYSLSNSLVSTAPIIILMLGYELGKMISQSSGGKNEK